MSSTGPAIREIGYTYQGANNVFTGGYIPPTGLSGAALVADFERYQSELLDDLPNREPGSSLRGLQGWSPKSTLW